MIVSGKFYVWIRSPVSLGPILSQQKSFHCPAGCFVRQYPVLRRHRRSFAVPGAIAHHWLYSGYHCKRIFVDVQYTHNNGLIDSE